MPGTTRLLLSVAIGLALAGSAVAQTYRTTTGRAEFTSSVPLHTFTGRSDHLNGRIDLDAGTVDFYLDLETLDTGIGKRDKDMRKTLETGQYPFAEFFGRLSPGFDRAAAGRQPVTVSGTFRIHGVERPIEVSGTIEREGDTLRLEANWELRLEDYDIEPPSLLIMKVDQVQKLAIMAVLAPEQE